ncbi:MAG: hypothetical protein EZS26_002644 [Candidatus Ordinivivax streblomastigis]|uniref:Uncharacterized protein n=1 Tax=Candidatus Ordinivivax streblomastigis TaxID=2540710 RepID=A0A5M8NWY0_9BACT|nr:MAG: hypothetical protein EZS26_002644 [Candidatus Ordinivivax streblomastigis]
MTNFAATLSTTQIYPGCLQLACRYFSSVVRCGVVIAETWHTTSLPMAPDHTPARQMDGNGRCV